MFVKKSLNSFAISDGSVSRVPFLFICSMVEDDLFRFSPSFNICQVRLEFFMFLVKLSPYYFCLLCLSSVLNLFLWAAYILKSFCVLVLKYILCSFSLILRSVKISSFMKAFIRCLFLLSLKCMIGKCSSNRVLKMRQKVSKLVSTFRSESTGCQSVFTRAFFKARVFALFMCRLLVGLFLFTVTLRLDKIVHEVIADIINNSASIIFIKISIR